MTIRTKSTLKGYFNTGDIPTENNFSDWIETMSPREYKTVGSTGSDADYICDGTNDEVQIQEAIDEIATLPGFVIKRPDGSTYSGINNRGKVILLRGSYGIYDTIDLKGNVNLVITENACLYPMLDVNIINMRASSGILGGGLITTTAFANYSSSVIFVDGQEHIYYGMNTFIRDLYIQGCNENTGIAINFYAHHPSDMGYICAMNVKNIGIYKFEYGIKIEQDGQCWIGCNNFNNIMFYDTMNAIHIYDTVDWYGPYNNMFSYILCQQVLNTRAVYCDGWQNYFEPIIIWDTDPGNGGVAVEFTDREKCYGNRIEGRLETPVIDPSGRNFITNYG
jgi:hypothetical protein